MWGAVTKNKKIAAVKWSMLEQLGLAVRNEMAKLVVKWLRLNTNNDNNDDDDDDDNLLTAYLQSSSTSVKNNKKNLTYIKTVHLK